MHKSTHLEADQPEMDGEVHDSYKIFHYSFTLISDISSISNFSVLFTAMLVFRNQST